MDKKEYFKKFAEKLSLSIEEVEAEFNSVLKEEKEIHPELSIENLEERTLRRLALMYKKQLKSPAVGFEGIIIASSDCVDIIAKKKKEALDMFKTDPQRAVALGVTTEDGIPLETREIFNNGNKNPEYGKPLPEHNYIRNVWVIAQNTKTKTEPKLYSMVLSGKLAESEDIPNFKPIRFMAIDKGEKLNASQFTKFVIDEKIKIPAPETILGNFIASIKIPELVTYHQQNKEDYNRICCIEGDVSMLNLEPTAFGSRIMVLDDANASLEDLDSKSLTCWIPDRIKIDFAESSRVLVIGRTAQGFVKDENKNVTTELGDVTLNVYGVYAIPEFKVSIQEEVEELESLEVE